MLDKPVKLDAFARQLLYRRIRRLIGTVKFMIAKPPLCHTLDQRTQLVRRLDKPRLRPIRLMIQRITVNTLQFLRQLA